MVAARPITSSHPRPAGTSPVPPPCYLGDVQGQGPRAQDDGIADGRGKEDRPRPRLRDGVHSQQDVGTFAVAETTQPHRLLDLLRMLEHRQQGASLRDLAAEYGCNQKTIRRDLAALRRLGYLTEYFDVQTDSSIGSRCRRNGPTRP